MADPSTKYGAMAVYKRLFQYTRPYRVLGVFAIFGMAMDAAAQAGVAHLMEPLLDLGLVEKQLSVMFWLPFIIIGLFFLRAIASFSGNYAMASIGRSIVRDLRNDLFLNYLSLPARYFDRGSSGKMISTMVYNAEQVADSVTNAAKVLVQDALVAIALISLMLYKSVILTATFAIILPAIALVVSKVSVRFRRISRRIQESMGDVSQVTEEAVKGHKVLKIFGGKDYELSRFLKANNSNRSKQIKMFATKAMGSSIMEFAGSIALATIIFVASQNLADITPGIFVSFMIAMLALIPVLKRLATVNSPIQRGIAAAESIFRIMDSQSELDAGTKVLVNCRGEIQFKDVSLSYEGNGKAVLDGINLILRPGTVTALVGYSGAGKTSLASLIPKFYLPTQGQILLDAHDVNDYTLTDLRKQIAIVTQEIVLFNDTIRNNIAYGDLADSGDELLWRAIDDANAREFIEQSADGLDTFIGEGGALLSGGQRQRLVIARALLKDAPILILDEATSALDTKTEVSIQLALESLMKSRTTLIIAHRLSTIEKADQIVVLDSGKIVEVGNHKNLLNKGSHYASLYASRFENQ